MTDKTVNSTAIREITQLIKNCTPITVLTGAGVSASSGLPVYRNANGDWIHSEPVQGPKFRASEHIRKRYWCRSYFGWQAFSSATPNSAHLDLALLQRNNVISTIITQNVDGLHQSAGATNTIALHGNLSEVICLTCGNISTRAELQQRLQQQNPELMHIQFEIAPDGDAIINDTHIEKFNTVNCALCDGTLQPYVVFYGDNVPKTRVEDCMNHVLSSQMLLCIGTSLMVYSGYRFCMAAAKADIPVVIINDGVTRADELARFKVGGDCAEVLSSLQKALL